MVAPVGKLASIIPARGSKAAFTPIDSELGAWAKSALARTFASGGVDASTRRERADDAHDLAGPRLRVSSARAHGRSAAEKRDEVTPSQLITRHQLSPRTPDS